MTRGTLRLTMLRLTMLHVTVLAALAASAAPHGPADAAKVDLAVTDRSSGLRLRAVGSFGQVKLLVPGQPDSDRGIEVDCPEHVTVQRAATDVEHLYLRGSTSYPGRPDAWKRDGRSLSYRMDLPYATRMEVRVTLDREGIRVHYDFSNPGDTAFEMWQAPTCVKLTRGSPFYDARLERTYAHRADGCQLLAAELPDRLSLPLAQWLPCRVLDSYRWPAGPLRVERDGDITRYNLSRAVDLPALATRSADGKWAAATCTAAEIGNIWSNPDLTCHHTDPVTKLPARGHAAFEVRTFVVRGSVDQAFGKVRLYRSNP